MSQPSGFNVDSLIEPSSFTDVEDVPFSVEATLVHRLGSESVSDKVLSIIELIKNSYDADATEVVVTLKNFRTGNSEIIIRDNGSGMDYEQLKKGWLRIATSLKHSQEKTPILKRKMLGQKGVGRLAIENLSNVSKLLTYPRDKNAGYKVDFLWNDYTSKDSIGDVTNKIQKFSKNKLVHGTVIHLTDLRHKWQEKDVQKLRNFIRSLTPPSGTTAKFKVFVDTDEFEDLSGIVDSDFLEKSVFIFKYKLYKSGKVEYSFKKHKDKKEPKKNTTCLGRTFSCGPLEMTLNFFYRSKDKMKKAGIKIEDIHTLRSILDDYGGIKLYRDGIRLSGFGNPDDDWTGLDALARNDPTVIPARDQLLGTVSISSAYNPDISDTTARENVIKNDAFQDLLSVIKDAIGIFSQLRGEVEKKRQKTKNDPKKQVAQALRNLAKVTTREDLLDFATRYPQIFYQKLEDEINACFKAELPNASLVLSRKMVENLLFHLMQEKFRKDINLRFDRNKGRPHAFSLLIENLENKMSQFDEEQKNVLHALIPLMKNFRINSNKAAHKLYQFADSMDEIEKFKIDEMIEHLVGLIKDVKSK